MLGDSYSQNSFNVGSLCHQRLKLYHVMKHFKSEKHEHARARMHETGRVGRVLSHLVSRASLSSSSVCAGST